MRTTLVWRRAIRLPTVIDSAARMNITGCTMSLRSAKATNTSWISAANPAVLDATARNAVIGVGAPS